VESVRDIVVVGEGSASGTPDRCLVSLALNVAADTPAEALSGVGHVADRVLEALAGDGVPPSDVQTVGLSVRDVHDREKNRVTARVASYALSVGLPGLAGAGPLLARLASVAGDALQVRGLELVMSDPQPLLDRARRAAVVDALARATVLAEAAGVRTGPIVSIEEEAGVPPRAGPRRAKLSSGAEPYSLPVEGGTATVTVSVRVTMSLQDL